MLWLGILNTSVAHPIMTKNFAQLDKQKKIKDKILQQQNNRIIMILFGQIK